MSEPVYQGPRRYEFFQAVRLLRRLLPGRASIGTHSDPEDEFVRFRSAVDLSYPATDVVEIREPEEPRQPAEMTVSFMGVATPGSFGSLPTRYAEEVLARNADKNPALGEFFDLFNHRFISLFYRAWEKHQLAVRYEHDDHELFFERALFSAIGLGTPGLLGRLPFDERALLFRAGLLSMAPVPARVLEQLVESYFQVPARVEPFRPQWCALEESDQNRLGARNSGLGEDLIVGEQIRLVQFRFNLRIGPLDWSRYQEFLPSGSAYPALLELVRLATSQDLDWDVTVALQAEDVPPLKLEVSRDRPTRLGWSTWLTAKGLGRHAEDARFPGDREPQPGPGPPDGVSGQTSDAREAAA